MIDCVRDSIISPLQLLNQLWVQVSDSLIFPALLKLYESSQPLLKLNRKCHKEYFVAFCDCTYFSTFLSSNFRCNFLLPQIPGSDFRTSLRFPFFQASNILLSLPNPFLKILQSRQRNHLLARGVLTQLRSSRFANKPLYYWPFR